MTDPVSLKGLLRVDSSVSIVTPRSAGIGATSPLAVALGALAARCPGHFDCCGDLMFSQVFRSDDRRRDVRFWQVAARALEGIGPDAADAVPALVDALDDPYDEVRWSAARAGEDRPGCG